MLELRQKLSLGLGGLLLIMLIGGVQSLIQFKYLEKSIAVILRENYRSVTACQKMKEALERMDSGIIFAFLGYPRQGNEQIIKNEASDRTRKDATLAQESMYLFLLCGILVARAFQNRYFLKGIKLAAEPAQVYAAIQEWDNQAS